MIRKTEKHTPEEILGMRLAGAIVSVVCIAILSGVVVGVCQAAVEKVIEQNE